MSSNKKKIKIYVTLLVLIGLAYALDDSSSTDVNLFNFSTDNFKSDIHRLKRKKQKLLFERAQEKAKKQTSLANSNYFWKTEKRKVTDTLIHSEINRAASRASLTLRSISSAKISDISENIKQARTTITISCSMREASKLLQEIDNIQPKFFWSTCSIRPYTASRHAKNSNTVLISGSLVTYILDKKASKSIVGGK